MQREREGRTVRHRCALVGGADRERSGDSPGADQKAGTLLWVRGLWPMMRRVAVSGAMRAPRCRGWHEVRVDERTNR
eukprot:7108057-Prymnesium_polylepis.3